MGNSIQPSFKIRLFNGRRKNLDDLKGSGVVFNTDGDFIDIEPFVSYPVVYEEKAELLNTLNFTITRHADILLYYFHIGQAIALMGGYYSDSQRSMKHVFSGTVTRLRTRFEDDGGVTFSVECMNFGFTKLGKDFKHFVYPDPHSSRKFAQAKTLSAMDIIKGIAEENNFELGIIDLDAPNEDVVSVKRDFNAIKVSYQKGMTDWKYLNMLAQDFGCSVWVSNENGVEKLNFVNKRKAFSKQSEIGFLYPLQGRITSPRANEIQHFPDAPSRIRMLRSVSIDEDISAAHAVSRSAVYFDKETGEEKSTISEIEEKDGKRYMVFYELDEEKVAFIHRTDPERAKRIRESSPTGMEWGSKDNPDNAAYYYKRTQILDERTAMFDKAFFGITLSARTNQDLDIRSQRSYPVRGILSYHTKNLDTHFFLRGLKHIWDSDGTWTELEFIR